MEQTTDKLLKDLEAIGKCLEPDGWDFVKDATDPAWWLGKFKHISGAAVHAHAPNREGKWTFTPTDWPKSSVTKETYRPSRYGDFKWVLADIGVSASKPAERIAKDLKTRLLNLLPPVYQAQVQEMLKEEEKEGRRYAVAHAIAGKLGTTLNYRPGVTPIEIRSYKPYVLAKVLYGADVDISISGLSWEQVERVLDVLAENKAAG